VMLEAYHPPLIEWRVGILHWSACSERVPVKLLRWNLQRRTPIIKYPPVYNLTIA
jgi:hypothetical protein